ncbi:MAG: DUF1028 domain-containing protein [Holophagaceae bacterium]|nr:DUF1028 domain-containing protein [Holophagaceae bacterium]
MRIITSLALAACLAGPALAAQAPPARRPVHTFSIVARDPRTGDLGVAVQSHWFSVGSVVTWAEAGVGAVATQSFSDPRYGALGLEMLRAGHGAPDALRGLLAADADREVRQVAMVDASGRVAAHTGARCIQAAGHETGDQFSCEANLMDKATVWPAMARAYREALKDDRLDLADRLLAALRAAQAEGGDIRGQQSAALLIVKAKSSGKPWEDRVFDLRVEDHADPIGELSRLVKLRRAYILMDQGDGFVTAQKWEEARAAYEGAGWRRASWRCRSGRPWPSPALARPRTPCRSSSGSSPSSPSGGGWCPGWRRSASSPRTMPFSSASNPNDWRLDRAASRELNQPHLPSSPRSPAVSWFLPSAPMPALRPGDA